MAHVFVQRDIPPWLCIIRTLIFGKHIPTEPEIVYKPGPFEIFQIYRPIRGKSPRLKLTRWCVFHQSSLQNDPWTVDLTVWPVTARLRFLQVNVVVKVKRYRIRRLYILIPIRQFRTEDNQRSHPWRKVDRGQLGK